MTRIKEGAGLASPMDAARAQASEADGDSTYTAKEGDCARTLNRLTALTGIEQNSLKARLAARQGQLPIPNAVDVSGVAAQVLRQRPDIAIAEWNLASQCGECAGAQRRQDTGKIPTAFSGDGSALQRRFEQSHCTGRCQTRLVASAGLRHGA